MSGLIGCSKNTEVIEKELPSSPGQTTENISINPINFPPQQFPIPGWLGFTTIPPNTNTLPHFFWLPSHPEGQVVIFSQEWEKVEPGTHTKLWSELLFNRKDAETRRHGDTGIEKMALKL